MMALFYVVAQMFGSTLSMLVGKYCSPFWHQPGVDLHTLGMTIPSKGVSDGMAIGLEIVLTFGLVLGILTITDELREDTPWGINAGGLSVALYVGFFHIFDITLGVRIMSLSNSSFNA